MTNNIFQSFLFNEEHWSNFFNKIALSKGRQHVINQQVYNTTISNEFKNIKADIGNDESQIYHVEIELITENNDLSFYSYCNCDYQYDCEHAVAVLYFIKENPALSEQMTRRASLNSELQFWLNHLSPQCSVHVYNQYPDQILSRLLYILDIANDQPCIKFICAQIMSQGGYYKIGHFDPQLILKPVLPEFILQEDVDIIEDILSLPHVHHVNNPDSYQIPAKAFNALLQKILLTQRCHWHDFKTPALSQGKPEKTAINWQIHPNGDQTIKFDLSAQTQFTLIPSQPLCYVNTATYECGFVKTDIADDLTYALYRAPTIPAPQASLFRIELEKRIHSNTLPLPSQMGEIMSKVVMPVPRLKLMAIDQSSASPGRWSGYISKQMTPTIALNFNYDHNVVAHHDKTKDIMIFQGDHLYQIPRQTAFENQALEQLKQFGLQLTQNIYQRHLLPHQFFDIFSWPDNPFESGLTFMMDQLPELKHKGWQVQIDPTWPHKIAEEIDDWYADIGETTGIDWFELELGVVIGGQQINLLPLLLKYIQSLPDELSLDIIARMNDDAMLLPRLDDGRILPVPVGRFRSILETLMELFESQPLDRNGKLLLPKNQSTKLAELEASNHATQLRWLGGEPLREFGKKLLNFKKITDVTVPENFHATLRQYQQQGLNWLQFLREYQLGGILADDMGLGKTVQTLAHIMIEKNQGRLLQPALVIATTSLTVNWRMEAKRFTPDLRVLTLHGPERKEAYKTLSDFDLVITTYPLLSRDSEELLPNHFHLLILDEAHHIKNPKTKATQIVQLIKANHRLCLTGTPMENHLGELWSIFNFLTPGLLGDMKQFRRQFRMPIEKHQDQVKLQLLQKRISPFMLRRTKSQVIKELPPKTEIIRSIELDTVQRDLYESIRLAMHRKVQKAINTKGINQSQIVILDALLKLRQVCCDPRLINIRSGKRITQSAKLNMLMDFIPEMLEEGRRILLFSQFTGMLGLIEAKLREVDIQYVKLTGQTKDREAPITQFQAGEVPLFLISLKAGGVGLNLTAADTVIHYDPWWNPAVERQATDRAHRIGQDKSDFVYKLITCGTVEEKILELQKRKQALADGLFEGKCDTTANLTREDLNVLFEPLA